ncbi:MAG: hypothetical protein AAFW67_04985 [Cyanobacteria bacterium J06638_38]
MTKAKAVEFLTNYLAQIANNISKRPGWKYSCFEELILNRGSLFDKMNDRDPLSCSGQKGLCYYNCLQAINADAFASSAVRRTVRTLPAFAYARYSYCEGFAVNRELNFVYYHAWLCDRLRAVVDPTWDDGSAYYGIIFDNSWVLDLMSSRSHRAARSADRRLTTTGTHSRPRFFGVIERGGGSGFPSISNHVVESNYLDEINFLQSGFSPEAFGKGDAE